MDGRTAAATLGVGPQATRDEIRRAFRAAVKRVHPDVDPSGTSDAFITLRAAFEALMAAPAAPVAASSARVGSAPGSACRSRWMSAVSPSTRTGPAGSRTTIDVTDVGAVRSERRRPSPVASPAPIGPRRDAAGLSFDDHLSAALARA